MQHFVLSFVVLLPATMTLGAGKVDPLKTVKIGVLTVPGSVGAIRNWQPMTSHLDTMIRGYRFEIVPMSIEATGRAVREKAVDFLITSTDEYVLLESK